MDEVDEDEVLLLWAAV